MGFDDDDEFQNNTPTFKKKHDTQVEQHVTTFALFPFCCLRAQAVWMGVEQAHQLSLEQVVELD